MNEDIHCYKNREDERYKLWELVRNMLKTTVV